MIEAVTGAMTEAVQPVLCVDFGTCTTQAAVVIDAIPQLLHDPGSGSTRWPSVVFLDQGTLLVGRAAEKRKRVQPANFRKEFKRDLGQQAPLIVGDARYSATELLTAVLRALRTEAERLIGGPVRQALLTMPASCGVDDPRRVALLDAAADAGFTVVELLAEPVAAALAPVSRRGFAAGDLVLVYDLGGGTFDTALVRLGTEDHEVLGSDTIDDCGGRDLDASLLSAVLGQLGEDPEQLIGATFPEDDAAARRMIDLVDLAIDLKEQLSDTELAREYTRDNQPITISRAELTRLAAPLLDRTIASCRSLLGRAGVATEEITGVLPVGGSTRSPVVVEAVASGLGLALLQPQDAQHAVILGACAWAQRTPYRTIAPIEPAPGVEPLAWALPGGRATLAEPAAAPGTGYQRGAVLARVRAADGSLHQLVADRPGTIVRWHAVPGQLVVSGDWLVTTEAAACGAAPPLLLDNPTRTRVDDVAWAARCLAFPPDGSCLAVAANDEVILCDAVTGEITETIPHSGEVRRVHFTTAPSNGGLVLLSRTAGNEFRAFQLEPGSPGGTRSVTEIGRKGLAFPPGFEVAVAHAPEGRLLATRARQKIAIWSVDTGERLATLPATGVTALAMTRDGARLAVAEAESSISIWTLRSPAGGP